MIILRGYGHNEGVIVTCDITNTYVQQSNRMECYLTVLGHGWRLGGFELEELI